MYKIGVCGHFGKGENLLNGQTIKTKVITEELKGLFGNDSVISVDTRNWKRNPLLLLLRCIGLFIKCNDIIILPARNGVKVFVPLFVVFNTLFRKQVHYVVIGGWLPELLAKHKWLKFWLSKFNRLYVETRSIVEMLEKEGLANVTYLPNFRRTNTLSEDELIYTKGQPYKLCTFSRITKEKGIEEAIEAVKIANESLGYNAYSLDIYGEVEEPYKERFEELKNVFPSYISYKGTVTDYHNCVNVLKEYFALLFPTYYKGEGFAGALIDSFAAGLPVIATDWKYNPEIIKNKTDGLIYDYREPKELQKILIRVIDNPSEINDMKINCLAKAKEFSPENVMNQFVKNLNTH